MGMSAEETASWDRRLHGEHRTTKSEMLLARGAGWRVTCSKAVSTFVTLLLGALWL